MEGIVKTEEVLGGEPRLEGWRPALCGPSRARLPLRKPEKMAQVRERHRERMVEARGGALEPPETLTG